MIIVYYIGWSGTLRFCGVICHGLVLPEVFVRDGVDADVLISMTIDKSMVCFWSNMGSVLRLVSIIDDAFERSMKTTAVDTTKG